MPMRGWLYRPNRWIPVLLVTAIFSTWAMPQPCAGNYKGIRSTELSLDLKDEPLGKVVERISDITGYQITISPEWMGLPISARFQNLPIDQGLRRILSGVNHYIVFNDAGPRISIVIKSSLNGEKFRMGRMVRQVGGNTPGALQSSTANSKDFAKPGDIQVLPPNKPGEGGVTKKEIEEIKSRWPETEPGNLEVIPPAEFGERGTTLKEIRAQRNVQPSGVFNETELVPPDRFGQK
jgi:hypothetical protein